MEPTKPNEEPTQNLEQENDEINPQDEVPGNFIFILGFSDQWPYFVQYLI